MPKYRWKVYNRFSDLPTPGNPPELVAPENPRRVDLVFRNIGSGSVYISDEITELAANNGWEIPADGVFAPGTPPIVPQNAIYAVADSGHDLRVSEIVME